MLAQELEMCRARPCPCVVCTSTATTDKSKTAERKPKTGTVTDIYQDGSDSDMDDVDVEREELVSREIEQLYGDHCKLDGCGGVQQDDRDDRAIQVPLPCTAE